MIDEFEIFREALAGRGQHGASPPWHAPARSRLIGSALSRMHRCAPGEADLAVLTRHAIRREQEKQGGVSPTVAVPRTAPWPAPAAWEKYGVDVISVTE